MFQPIDLAHWPQRAHYEAVMAEGGGSDAYTLSLDVTPLAGAALYPTLLWLLTRAVNRLPSFRTALTPVGLGTYDRMHPAYTIFQPAHQTFSAIWTPYREDYGAFLEAYRRDVAAYTGQTAYAPKPGRPENSFDISMVPWFSFGGFSLMVPGGGDYLLPIFTLGKVTEQGGRRTLPLAVQVHRAVCGGQQVACFLHLLEGEMAAWAGEKKALDFPCPAVL